MAIARTGSLRQAPEYMGTTYPQRQISLRSQVEGKLLNLNVDVGSPVTRGQKLAQLDDTILLTTVTQAEAELASSESEVARARTLVSNARAKVEQARLQQQQAQNDAARLQQLLRAGAIPKQQAEQAQTTAATSAQNLRAIQEQVGTEQQAVAAAQAKVLAQRAVIALARERQSYALLSSPITGIVLEKVTEPGNLVQPGGEILKIGDFSRVKVVLQISELELSNIRVGQSVPVILDAFPNQELIGQITLISPVADAQARLVPVEVSIPNNNGRIGSGLLARVKFLTPTSEKVIIPQTALQKSREPRRKQTNFQQNPPSSESKPGFSKKPGLSQETVFVLVGEGRQAKVAARSVKVGDRANNQVEIISGLEPGERFVTRSSKPLKDGDRVRLSVLSETNKPAGNRMQNREMTGFSISAIAIRRHIGTLVLTVAVIVVGIYFLSQLQVDLLPSITYPRIGVRLTAPGVSPEVAVEEITKPLEKALSATEGVVQVFSQTREGQVSVDLFFKPGCLIDQALNDATASFNRAQGNFPDIVQQPRLFKLDPSQSPVYELALTSPSLQDVELRVFAEEELVRELSVVPGVASVDVAGGVQEEVRVKLDLQRMQALGVGLKPVLDALRDRNQDISGGRLQESNGQPLTRTVGKFQDASQIQDLSFEVKASGISSSPSRVYLRDFADVIDGTQEQRVFVSVNGEPAVKISIQKQPDANTVTVVDGVKKLLENLKQSGAIAADMTLIPTLDESRFIRNSLADVTTSGVSGALLAAAAVLLFLGSLRQTLIISLAIPLCTLAAIILMKLFGLSLNLFSLGGLALGIGQAIDTSVVILENVSEGVGIIPGQTSRPRLQDKEQFMQETILRSQEVESALIAATGANLVSVVPFFLIGGFFSLLFNELILTICFAVAASLLVALTIVPMLTSRLLAIQWSSRIGEFWLLQVFNRRFEDATRSYSSALVKAVRYRVLVVAIAFLVLGSGGLFLSGQLAQEILPRINTGLANLNAQFPPGTNLETNRKVMAIVDDILLKEPETEYVFSTAGGSLFGTSTSANPSRASGTITLKPGTNVAAYAQRVSKEFEKLNLAGIRLRVSPGQLRGIILTNSPVRGAEVDIILQGNDERQLQQAGRQVLQALDEQATLVQFRPDADERQPEVQIRPDWQRLSALGLTTTDIGNTIQTAIEGSVPTQLQRGDRLVDVRVQLNREALQQASPCIKPGARKLLRFIQ